MLNFLLNSNKIPLCYLEVIGKFMDRNHQSDLTPLCTFCVYFLRAVAHSQYVIFPCFCLSLSEQASNLERSFVRNGGNCIFCRNFCLARETFLTSDFDHGHKIFIHSKNEKNNPFLTTFNCYEKIKRTLTYVNKMERKKCKKSNGILKFIYSEKATKLCKF